MKKILFAAIIVLVIGCNLQNPRVQRVAQDVNDMLPAVREALPFVPSPIKEGLLAALAVTGAVVGAVQKRKVVKMEKSLSEIIMGLEDVKKKDIISSIADFADSMNAAQSVETKKIVDRLQG